MKIIVQLFFGMLCVVTTSNAQNSNHEQVLEHALEKGNDRVMYFLNHDFESFLAMTHPKMIDFAGGKEKLLKNLKKSANDVLVISNDLSNSSNLMINNNIYQCILKQDQIFMINQEQQTSSDSIYCISYDYGKTWFFLSIGNQSMKDIKEIIPELDSSLLAVTSQKIY